MPCHCYGPVGLTCEELEQLPKIMVNPDELQSLVYQDIDGLTMDQACAKMGVSKTVYAGIYQSARYKIIQAFTTGSVLTVCQTK